jgi:hypothetical protein
MVICFHGRVVRGKAGQGVTVHIREVRGSIPFAYYYTLTTDTMLNTIDDTHLTQFMRHMRETPYNSKRGVISSPESRSKQKLRYRMPKTMQNIHTALCGIGPLPTAMQLTTTLI